MVLKAHLKTAVVRQVVLKDKKSNFTILFIREKRMYKVAEDTKECKNKKSEQAYKPGSVLDGHLSWYTVTSIIMRS